MRFFFYGTLIDPEILRSVLQRSVDPIRRRKAVLKGYRRVYRRGASYPIIIADTTAQVEGVVVSELTNRDIMLLTMYEGQEYEIRELPVSCSGTGLLRAKVFYPARDARPHARVGRQRIGISGSGMPSSGASPATGEQAQGVCDKVLPFGCGDYAMMIVCVRLRRL
jgi:Gamma-glutamyl cyclotransferase, AIG2-like